LLANTATVETRLIITRFTITLYYPSSANVKKEVNDAIIEILNVYQIIFNVTAVDEELDDDFED
jgi:hypothetical protein